MHNDIVLYWKMPTMPRFTTHIAAICICYFFPNVHGQFNEFLGMFVLWKTSCCIELSVCPAGVALRCPWLLSTLTVVRICYWFVLIIQFLWFFSVFFFMMQQRVRNCRKCRNHGIIIPEKNHKKNCVRGHCVCAKCVYVNMYNRNQKEDISTRRQIQRQSKKLYWKIIQNSLKFTILISYYSFGIVENLR